MSNSQTWAETMAPINSAYREQVLQHTWGHLAPVKNTSYKGKILFTISGYTDANKVIVDSNFEGLGDSPWLYDAMIEEIHKWDIEDAGIYLLETTFRNFRFYGKPRKVYSI